MSFGRILLAFALLLPVGRSLAAPFAMFPKTQRLVSSDGKFEVRDEGRQGAASEFVGSFHSLWLTELDTGRSRKLCDYLGVAAVAWSGNDYLMITQYVGKKTSRVLVFAASGAEEPLVLDTSTLIQLVPVELRPALRENDHAFVEASRLDAAIFYFRVWGYGKHDPDGFRWNCGYSLIESTLSCAVANGK